MSSKSEILRFLEVLIWPAVAVMAILVVRPHLSRLLSGAKIKIPLGGLSVETTLPELKQILEEQTGEALSSGQVDYLISVQRDGAKRYAQGVESNEERKFLRPLRNAGLVLTVPRNAFLHDAEAIELSALGRLYLRARAAASKGNG